jgi:WhiB family transcriptional regulator, redox-sensing transcriptional regulator
MPRGPGSYISINHSGPEWYTMAECRGSNPLLFISSGDVSTSKRHENERIAKSICEVCDVQGECLEYALNNPVAAPYGIWGGKNERERRALRAERKRKRAS